MNNQGGWPIVSSGMGSSRALLPAYLLSAVAVLAAALGSLVVMETATVKLTVPASKIVANRTITGGQSGRDLTTTRIEASVTDNQLGVATADVVPPAYAGGQVTLSCSTCPSTPQAIAQGTVVSTTTKIHFATLTRTQVSSGAKSATVDIRALVPGVGGNVAVNTITVIDTPISGVSVTNSKAITGGIDATSVQVIHQSDIDLARFALTTKITQDLNAALGAQAGGLSFAADGQPALVVTTDHQVGDKVPTFTMTMTATVGAVAFSESQADALMRTAVDQKIPKGFQLTTSPVQTNYVVQHSGVNGDVTLKGSATALMVPNVSAAELKTRIKGMRVDAARKQLEQLAPGATIDISVKPSVPWLPIVQDHISLTIVIQPATTV
jgi:hypothetical protein